MDALFIFSARARQQRVSASFCCFWLTRVARTPRRKLEELAPAEKNGNGNTAATSSDACCAAAAEARAPWERVLRVERARCATLHDLRKGIREARYRMELFSPLFDASPSTFQEQLSAILELQGALGTMHDVQVCLAAQPRLADCGALAAALTEAHDDAWATFRRGRAALLAPAGRHAFARALLLPPPQLDADSS
jgi:CHAD domain-containing protein